MIFKFKLRKRHDKRAMNPSLLDRINRNEIEDQIEIGRIVEDAINSEFGTLLNVIINGLIDEEIYESRSSRNKLSSDRILGRIESYNKLQDALETCMATKKELQEDIRKESSVSDVTNDTNKESVGPQAI